MCLTKYKINCKSNLPASNPIGMYAWHLGLLLDVKPVCLIRYPIRNQQANHHCMLIRKKNRNAVAMLSFAAVMETHLTISIDTLSKKGEETQSTHQLHSAGSNPSHFVGQDFIFQINLTLEKILTNATNRYILCTNRYVRFPKVTCTRICKHKCTCCHIPRRSEVCMHLYQALPCTCSPRT